MKIYEQTQVAWGFTGDFSYPMNIMGLFIKRIQIFIVKVDTAFHEVSLLPYRSTPSVRQC